MWQNQYLTVAGGWGGGRYAMLELCTAEEATMALGMDGTRYANQVLKIRRPQV
jgi:hypothetical protein